MRSLIIDNYDSFTHNIYQLLAQVNQTVPTIITNDQLSWQEIQNLNFDNIIISPGPGNPSKIDDFGICKDVLINSEIPVLGICLGHQGLGYYYGSKIKKAPMPMHGRLSKIYHNNNPLFKDIPSGFSVVRYHSLIIDNLGDNLECIATTEDNLIMAICHKNKPFWGVQFHPESICSEYGFTLLKNFAHLTKQLSKKNNNKFNFSQSSVIRETFNNKTPLIKDQFYPSKPSLIRGAFEQEEYQVYSLKLDFWLDTEIVFKALFSQSDYCFWLDSSMVEKGLSRFSFMGDSKGINSFVVRYSINDKLEIIQDEKCLTIDDDLFTFLQQHLDNYVCNNIDLPFNFNCGFVGFFGYELKSLFGYSNQHKSGLPDCYLIKCDRTLAFDHQEKVIYLLYLDKKYHDFEAKKWFEKIKSKLIFLSKKNDNSSVQETINSQDKIEFNFTRNKQQYLENINICFEKIKQGESYEICLTNQLNLAPIDNPLNFYSLLRKQNPAPYSAYLKLGKIVVVCSSPERFLHLDKNRWLESKPIKGTVKRGKNQEEDLILQQQLSLSEKEKAENLMIVDLLRNDLGKICEVGSISVPKLMAIETYTTVHQMVSTVRGKLKSHTKAIDCFNAIFPGGSMTGAPKKRTLEIIDQLETEARGIYSGSIGFLALNGTLDLNIVIRSAVITPEKTTIGVGGAITILSDQNQEFEEIKLKAYALLKAYGTIIDE